MLTEGQLLRLQRPVIGGDARFCVSAGGLDPIVSAACVAFGFVFVNPFEDGIGASTDGYCTTSSLGAGSTRRASTFRSPRYFLNGSRPIVQRPNISPDRR